MAALVGLQDQTMERKTIMTEWGLFNDEGLVMGGFQSAPNALAGRAALEVAEVCSDCRSERAEDCACDTDVSHD